MSRLFLDNIMNPAISFSRTTRKEIDNPGAGDCAFYAFAIGLIDIIQQEETIGQTGMFDRWVELSPAVKNLCRSIQNFNIHVSTYSQKKLLDTLQHSLREIVFQRKVNELRHACVLACDDNYAPLFSNSDYINFAELYFESGSEGDNYNVFAIHEIKKKIAELPRSENFAVHSILISLMLFLLYGNNVTLNSVNTETQPRENSLIIKALKRVTQDNIWWGTPDNLNQLAVAFDLNLNILVNRRAPYPFIGNRQDRPTMELNNIGGSQVGGRGQYSGGFHWTTIIQVKERVVPKVSTVLPSVYSSSIKKEPKTPQKKSATPFNPTLFYKTTPLSSFIKNSPKIELQRIKQLVLDAQVEYCDYSKKTWFSFFHRHGATGRKRAQKFNQEIQATENYSDIKDKILFYLDNKKNGNTHPHSFRTILLSHLLAPQKKYTYSEVSKKFDIKFQKLEQKLQIFSVPKPLKAK